MLRALNTAASGMSAQETNVNTISNNIANVNTTGFKKGRAEFEDLLYETVQEAGARSSENTQYNVGVQVGSGSKISAVRKDFTPGSPLVTNNPFDLMINGEGFFGVVAPNGGLTYTRDGSFSVDAQGSLVNKSGLRLFPGFTLPPGTVSVNVSTTGDVDAFSQGATDAQNIGKIPIFTFTNQVGLKSAGGNTYRATSASGAPQQKNAGEAGAGSIQQGTLESSNVKVMNEMTNLIRAQRAYEMNSKVMGVADQMLQATNNIR